jgi:peptidoglycan/LPS O-acetylase OafA/YrhL
VSLAGWPSLAVLLVYCTNAAFIALPGIIFVLYVGAFYGTISRRIFANLWIASRGGMCYSIYLLHNYATAAVGSVTGKIGQTLPFDLWLPIQTLIVTPIILAFSIVFYRSIEQPCMRSDWPARFKVFLTRFVSRVPKTASA